MADPATPAAHKQPDQQELVMSIMIGDLEGVRQQLDLGADPNAPNTYGDLPLFKAITSFKKIEIFDLLIERGASIDVTRYKGYTPLIQSVINRHIEVTSRLLELGIDIDKKDDDGNTAMDHALKDRPAGGVEDIIQLLQTETVHRAELSALAAVKRAQEEMVAAKIQRVKEAARKSKLRIMP